MPRLLRIARSAAFRFALLHTLVFVVLVAAVGFTAETLVTRALKQQAQQRIEEEAAELLGEFEQYGSEAFRKLIDAQVSRGENRLHYAVIGPEGQRVAGEQLLVRTAARAQPTAPGGVTEVVLSRSDAMLVVKRPLPNATTLLVADDLADIEKVEDVVSGAFSIVLAVSALLGLIAGIVLSGVILRRVNAVTRTAEAIIAGDLSRRIERTGSNDDFDRLAATLNTMLDRISSLMENLHQVSNDIAHDLRTPLSRLCQTLEHATTHAGTVRDYKIAVQRAMGEADGLLATFSALLRIAQIEAGARRAAFRPVNLTDVLVTVCEAYGLAAEEGGRAIATEIAPNLTVEGDRELLIQLFANLIENALGHTPVGTTIQVRLRAPQADRDDAIAEVIDDGPGIPACERDKVLRRFYRLEHSRTSPGNGLGLSTVSAIAELHGAIIEILDNRPGLLVRIRVPCRK